MLLPQPIQDVIHAFSRLPGIGPKTASRLAFHLLKTQDELAIDLAKALFDLKTSIRTCPICFNIMDAKSEQCEICINPDRPKNIICVVEEALDVVALERTNAFDGSYHILQGVLSPIEGIGPDELRIRELIDRVNQGGVEEIILATNPSMEGDATAMYLQKQLGQLEVKVTRLARGLPMGGDLEYADPNTLMRALAGRQELG
jgi:recombination protein RecR